MDLKLFFDAIVGDTVALVSGAGSVVLLVLGLTLYFKKPTPRWVVLAIAALCFFLAGARVWTAEHRARIEAERIKAEAERAKETTEKRLEALTIPNLSGEISLFSVFPAHDNKDAVVTLVAKIKNNGAPSIAEIQNIKARLTNGQELTLTPVPITDKLKTITLLRRQGEPGIVLMANDYLPNKLLIAPVPTGGAVQGFVMALARGITKDELSQVGTLLIIDFQDINGRPFSISRPISGQRMEIVDVEKLQHHQMQFTQPPKP
jgi:hypothetical protein